MTKGRKKGVYHQGMRIEDGEQMLERRDIEDSYEEERKSSMVLGW